MKLELKNVNFQMIKTRPTISDVSFIAEKNEKITLMSVQNGGKSTLVKLILGFYPKFSGQILIDNVPVTELLPENLNALVIFDDYMLKKRKTVLEEMQYGLKIRGVPKSFWQEKIERALNLVGMIGCVDKKIYELSRVEKFFVALARGVARSPALVIFDTPFCKMSESEEKEAKSKLKNILPKFDALTIITTDKISDGDFWQNRVIILNDGKISFDGGFEDSPYHNIKD